MERDQLPEHCGVTPQDTDALLCVPRRDTDETRLSAAGSVENGRTRASRETGAAAPSDTSKPHLASVSSRRGQAVKARRLLPVCLPAVP